MAIGMMRGREKEFKKLEKDIDEEMESKADLKRKYGDD